MWARGPGERTVVRALHQAGSSLNRPKKLALGGDLSKTLLPVADELVTSCLS